MTKLKSLLMLAVIDTDVFLRTSYIKLASILIKKPLYTLIILFLLTGKTGFGKSNYAADSVYLFSYASGKNSHKDGLNFAWSRDQKKWFLIGNEYSFVKSDYGRWGAEKRMYSPYLFRDEQGLWHCVWSLNDRDKVFAYTYSRDLINWGRQSYPEVSMGENCLEPMISYNEADKVYNIIYHDSKNQYFSLSTKNFKDYSKARPVKADPLRVTVQLPNREATGQIHRVAWDVVEKLEQAYTAKMYREQLYRETTQQDSVRFAGLKLLKASVTLQAEQAKPISDMLIGVFFEDINYAADGGLYAELIQNRGFEYKLSDKEGNDKSWNSKHSWKLEGSNASFSIDSTAPLSKNNPHYAILSTQSAGAKLINAGFDGIPVKKGENYDFSAFVKNIGAKQLRLRISLIDEKGVSVAEKTLEAKASGWTKIQGKLGATGSADRCVLSIELLQPGKFALDMISLFPEKTFKGRRNGLRADLASLIADIHPKFVRFPGGCVAHGDGIENIYQWKNTIGPLEQRIPQRNLWGYQQSMGLGYFEYFQFCEDIGAEPVPVIAAGVPCQNSGTGGAGQQGGIPLDEMDDYIQDIIDLVEYANGDVHTKWGKMRADAGHPEPFNLKYIGIGNEDLISDVFEERFTMIFEAMKKAHPEITVIGTVGPFSEGTDYREGWKIADRLNVPMVDEHYYQPPGWFIHNQDYYDKYDRSKSKVYLGEYAAHLPGHPNLETALSEALYLTNVERNGDVVHMTSYAPLLAKNGHTQWSKDMIYFDNTEAKPTVGYYVQQLFGQNAGDRYITTQLDLSNMEQNVRERINCSVVKNTESNELIVKLVNILPVAVQTDLKLGSEVSNNAQASVSVISGNPSDTSLRPVLKNMNVSENSQLDLPPYSFTVLKVKLK